MGLSLRASKTHPVEQPISAERPERRQQTLWTQRFPELAQQLFVLQLECRYLEAMQDQARLEQAHLKKLLLIRSGEAQCAPSHIAAAILERMQHPLLLVLQEQQLLQFWLPWPQPQQHFPPH